MKKFFLLFFFIPLVTAATILEYTETDLINLRPTATDADKDVLTYYFDKPLSREGVWQTTYGDAGLYQTRVVVSDGRLSSEKNITIIIDKKEEKPEITVKSPINKNLYIEESDSLFFNVDVRDKNDDVLEVTWYLDGQKVGEGLFYTYQTDYYSEGDHIITAEVDDGASKVREKWLVEVADINRLEILEEFEDITINETDTIILKLPDFSSVDLLYNLSGPIGESLKWETDFDDAGVYVQTIAIWDGLGFYEEKSFLIIVNDVDRPAELTSKSSVQVYEGEFLEFNVSAFDADGDEIEINALNLPEGAEFDGQTIKWTPSYDLVNKESIVDEITTRYQAMNRNFVIPIELKSNLFKVTYPVAIRVFNNNRPPHIDEIEEVVVKEGEIISFNVTATDPDEDELSYEVQGFIDHNNYQTKIGDAGTYKVRVLVNDGEFSDSTLLKIIILEQNQAPTIEDIFTPRAKEAEEYRLEFSAHDADGDELSFSVIPELEGAYFNDNVFVWTPSYETVRGENRRVVNLTFAVSDGVESAYLHKEIEVQNVNRPITLTTSAQVDDETFGIAEQIPLFVNVDNPDADDLTYTWKTSFFNTIDGNDTLLLSYDSAGSKKVSVRVSDGQYTVERSWKFTIVKKPKIEVITLE